MRRAAAAQLCSRVARRRKELGLRLALGAERGSGGHQDQRQIPPCLRPLGVAARELGGEQPTVGVAHQYHRSLDAVQDTAQVAGVAQLLHGGGAVALGELLAVRPVQQRDVRVRGRLRPERAQARHLGGRTLLCLLDHAAAELEDGDILVVAGETKRAEGTRPKLPAPIGTPPTMLAKATPHSSEVPIGWLKLAVLMSVGTLCLPFQAWIYSCGIVSRRMKVSSHSLK